MPEITNNKDVEKKSNNKAAKILATGRRKEAVARVQLSVGGGKITINKRPLNSYFNRSLYQQVVVESFKATDTMGKFDVSAKVEGGGLTGQADAIRLGIARALTIFDPKLRPALRKRGLLTRDPRERERKKFGQKGARKKFQWTKR
ncbi:MAG: 30S ribosomal protein S9 [Candidatus Omnitrophica bacterium]|nr:30S ribosomal protein S9 [Candidatus Omnitrophota bacterium]